ncbi:AAA family ATPase [Hungatella sp.]|uniref:AAA family ATPase n=1 Tax=Hungatella sp. TaxID=2613924 RepID=UPI003AB3947D
MPLNKISLKNFTVFDQLDMEFSGGINVFVGVNGKGKTHIMKVLYSACQSADKRVSFAQKIVRCFSPDDHRISRLVRRKQGNNDAFLRVVGSDVNGTESKSISAKFSAKTKKWEADITGEEGWEKLFQYLPSTFIPAKEILSNSYNLNAAVEKNNVSFDDTYLDIVNSAKIDISVGKNAAAKQSILNGIEQIIEGKVLFDTKRDEFYLKHGNSKLEFNLVAEGIRKIALVWQLVKNGTLEKGAVLFWDEPEANINPVHIPIIVDMLFELQRNGVQIFIATHDYIFSKYIEIKTQKVDQVSFFSFYDENESVCCESNRRFSELRHNPIIAAFDKLLDEVYAERVGDNGR